MSAFILHHSNTIFSTTSRLILRPFFCTAISTEKEIEQMKKAHQIPNTCIHAFSQDVIIWSYYQYWIWYMLHWQPYIDG